VFTCCRLVRVGSVCLLLLFRAVLPSSSCSVIQRAERRHLAACAGAFSSCKILGRCTFQVVVCSSGWFTQAAERSTGAAMTTV
jgi:hypothetical protein